MDTQIAEATPGIGHNLPPLAEMLPEETADLKKRADDLVAAAGRATVTDDDTAGKATLLLRMMTEHAKKIEDARTERKRPFLEAERTVDAHFGAIRISLIGADPKGKVAGPAGAVLALVDTYRRDQEAKAAAERRRLEEEARQAREAAAAAERAQQEAEAARVREAEEAAARIRAAEEEARRAGNAEAEAKAAKDRAEAETRRKVEEAAATQRRLDSEVEARRLREQADAATRQAAAVTTAPIDTGLGVKASGRKSYRAEITDLTVAIRHARRVNETAIREAVQKVYDAQVRAGVRDLPGAEVKEESSTVIRR